MLNSYEIGLNLKEFAKKNFGSFAELARRLDMTPQAIQIYLKGESIPGGGILAKLAELGCDFVQQFYIFLRLV